MTSNRADESRVDVLEHVSTGLMFPSEHQAILETLLRGVEIVYVRATPGSALNSGGKYASFFTRILGRFR